ncbi:MAG: hypothetical protein EON54_03560 [Alcaligenaceae bacterium]|nr:MAG: hypothetical protein EON54_03560 [Alcaligenaceae bacterium]
MLTTDLLHARLQVLKLAAQSQSLEAQAELAEKIAQVMMDVDAQCDAELKAAERSGPANPAGQA